MLAVFALLNEGRYEQARAPARAMLANAERTGEMRHVANALMALALIDQRTGDYLQAEAHARRVLTLPPDQVVFAGAWGAIGDALQEQGRYDEAAEAFQTAIALNESEAGAPADLSNWLNTLAIVRGHQGLYRQGEDLFRRAIEVAEVNNVEEGRRIASANLAWNLHQQRRHAEAEDALRRTIVEVRAAEGENAVNYGASVTNLAGELQAQGRHAEALVEFRRALPVFEQAVGRDHPQTAWTINAMARSVEAVEGPRAAAPLYMEAVALSLATRPSGHPESIGMIVDLAEHLIGTGKDPEALDVLRNVGDIARRRAQSAERHGSTHGQREFDRHRGIFRLQVQAAWDVAAGETLPS